MAKIIEFNGITKLDIPPEKILEKAKEAGLDGVVILGFDKNGEYYGASSYADGGTVLWLMELTRKKLLEVTIGDR